MIETAMARPSKEEDRLTAFAWAIVMTLGFLFWLSCLVLLGNFFGWSLWFRF